MKIEKLWLLGFVKLCCWITHVRGQVNQVNRPPRFVPGGDMAHFSLPEDLPVGSTVYKLRGTDPDEGSAVYYSISGAYFSVNKYSGDVILTKELDREVIDTIEVIISITDDPINSLESNTVSLKREIPIIDVNDNYPSFDLPQYEFTVSESIKPGTLLFNNITISDIDFGLNSMINLFCVQSVACQMFSISAEMMSEGKYRGTISLAQSLNYELQSSYMLWLKALDSNPKKPLSTMAKIIIDVEDVQDQPPVFFNAPYSISIMENTKPGKKLLTVEAKDGDVKNLRPVVFTLEQDNLHYFTIENLGNGNASIFTTENPIDREHPAIVQMGGIYSFYVKATELINNELPADETRELITVVIQDQDDLLPKFNKAIFRLNVSEDIAVGTPLPSLGMTVSDDDIGENAHFSLSLRAKDIKFSDCFSVEPTGVVGRSPVIIRVLNNSQLDYESGIREIKLYVIAFVTAKDGTPLEVATSELVLNVIDANDNAPEFSKSNYVINVDENTLVGTQIADIIATDRDSGVYSQITYTIGGFGMDKFDTDSEQGGLILTNKIDFEQQISYSLTIDAKDGGNRTATANILVNVMDVNDNAPVFDFTEYRRNIREGSQHFQPQFFVKATDPDGANNNRITYSVASSNSEAVNVDEVTGEIIMLESASSRHTTRGQYELRIKATDSGNPALSSETLVNIRVGIPGNQRPLFKGTPYNVTIPETLSPNSYVTTVRATDPDGPDDSLEYKISAGADNFYIKSKSGMIYLSENAKLDVSGTSSQKYDITVLAVDSGTPYRETAQATVTVNILDVNNKPPVFEKNNYIAHISGKTEVGAIVMNVKAKDADGDAHIEYSLLKPFHITDRRGFSISEPPENYNNLFSIDKDTGDIKLQRHLNNDIIHVVTVTAEARDTNAAKNIENQYDKVEVTFFVEVTDDLKPVFLVGGWMRSNPIITHNIFEEQPIGSNVLKISARDPLTMSQINKFQVKSTLPRQFAIDPSGSIVVTERIDYETIQNKVFSFTVEAISDDNQRRNEAKVIVHITDVNDHSPQFQYKNYQGSVEENSKKGTTVLYVTAVDGDLPTSPQGYGNVSYYLAGEHAFLFEIDPKEGRIMVGNKVVIDRERQPVLNLIAVAMDTPSGGKDRRKTEVPIQIDVLDVNDNAPFFPENDYWVIVPENCGAGVSVINVTATDPDIGPAGIVTFEIVDEFETPGLFKIDSKSGEIVIAKSLTGLGRDHLYGLTVRGLDHGEPGLFTDVQVSILIADVVVNDGVPAFVHPTEDEIAYISEDARVGSLVFQVVGVDPDDPFTPEGQIQYSFLRDSSDMDSFNIDSKTGLITTKVKLDRETKSRYSLIVMIKDGGAVPQQTTRMLQVHVNDTDDNVPLFKRTVDESPLQITMKEELPIGAVIQSIEAVDQDEGENSKIGYLITDGNEYNWFTINETVNNAAVIQVNDRINREEVSHVLLTVKCFKKREKPKMMYKKYNKTDLSERQVYIKILDIDDNLPEFEEKNITTGVRLNIPVDSLILTIVAHDNDVYDSSAATAVTYDIVNSSYVPPNSKLEVQKSTLPFTLNSHTGEIRTNSSLMKFVDGYFVLEITATSGAARNFSTNFVKIYVVRERGLLRFVFSKTPTEVKEYLTQFKSELENAIALPSVQLNIYDTQFHSKQDGSLDYTKTSSCFQVITDNYGTKETETFLKDERNHMLKDLYEKYSVQSIQRCGNSFSKPSMTWVQISLLSIAAFIGVTSIISSCILCCSYSRWQRLR